MSRKTRKNKVAELIKAVNSNTNKSSLVQSIQNSERIDYKQKFKQAKIDLDPSIRSDNNEY